MMNYAVKDILSEKNVLVIHSYAVINFLINLSVIVILEKILNVVKEILTEKNVNAHQMMNYAVKDILSEKNVLVLHSYAVINFLINLNVIVIQVKIQNVVKEIHT